MWVPKLKEYSTLYHFLCHRPSFMLNVNLLSLSPGFFNNCAKIIPDSSEIIPVELGKEFTAVCTLSENSIYSADDITWSIGNVTLPRQSYRNINKSSTVSLTISSDMNNPLLCKANKQDLSYEEQCMYGIYLDKGCKYLFLFSDHLNSFYRFYVFLYIRWQLRM